MRKLLILLALLALVAVPAVADAKTKVKASTDPNEPGRRLVSNMVVAFFVTPWTGWTTWWNPAPVVAKY